MSRFRQWLFSARQRLLFLPAVFTAFGVVAAIGAVSIDQFIVSGEDLPRMFRTSVDGGRQVLGTIATGLISAFALVLSLTLVAVQLASSQFSPRTVRNWLGDRILQRAIGLILGTVVFCLVVLYQTRSLGENDAFQPHLSVLAGIIMGLSALVVVLRAVDHLADSMRVGAVAQSILAETLALAHRVAEEPPIDRPGVNPSPHPVEGAPRTPPTGARIVEADRAGWIQEIDVDALLEACPEGAALHVPVAVGAFTLSQAPLAWITPTGAARPMDDIEAAVRDAIVIGDVRTMRQDLGFGIVRLVDMALRALSPSMNDANTAKDVIAHLGEVLLAVLANPERKGVRTAAGRRVTSTEYSHAEYVHAAFDQIRLSAIGQPQVLITLVRTLRTVRQEIERRSLPAEVTAIDELMAEIADDVRASALSERDQRRVLDVMAHQDRAPEAQPDPIR